MPRLVLACFATLAVSLLVALPTAQGRGGAAASADARTLLKPARVFDGDALHDGWAVLLRGDRIEVVGPLSTVPSQNATVVELPGTTLLPGLIEAHSHVLLHPYNETSWNDQVAHEAQALRVARATTSLEATLEAGFTTIRDLGTEGEVTPTLV